MAYLFDTDAISELWKPRPAASYLEWLETIHPEDQCTSAVVVGELYKGAFRSKDPRKWLRRIDTTFLSSVVVLAYDSRVARVYGEIRAELEAAGRTLEDADLQIAATAIHHELELVTGNVRHYSRIPGLQLNRMLADARGRR
jgi:predicted nucleic acid-binding protein